ncbi:hypothetical protein NPIL_429381 [Nephila pilipes]|uniref:Uncharacterized protein n=1 Tax=Nephila pilipes TaxID=299642 RepID=A0A8X6QDP1_NEPPI|nr:hypothetical protein NPIL_429381 [Nephila pilipes]
MVTILFLLPVIFSYLWLSRKREHITLLASDGRRDRNSSTQITEADFIRETLDRFRLLAKMIPYLFRDFASSLNGLGVIKMSLQGKGWRCGPGKDALEKDGGWRAGKKKKRLKEEEKVPERRQRHFILGYRFCSIPTWDLTPGVKKSLKGYAKKPEEYIGESVPIDPFVGHENLELIPPEISQLKATRSNLLRVSSGQNCIRRCFLDTNVFHGIIYQAAR